MNIAFLTFSSKTQKYFRRVVCQLELAGHRTRRFFELDNSDDSKAFVQCSWTRFSLKEIEAFSPDVIILFNGFGWNAVGASNFVARRWPTLFAEMGWFPQRDNIYFDRFGTGGRSSLSRTDLGQRNDLDDEQVSLEFDKLTQKYSVERRPANLSSKYILIPLQLEKDTSILWDSPYFKTIESLVDFVATVYPDQELLVKTHPLAPCPFKSTYPNVRVVGNEIAISTLLAHANRVIGINSTVLLEALLFLKPVAALGTGVGSSSGVFFDKEVCLTNPRAFLSYEPNVDRIRRTVVRLSRLQYEWESGRGAALDQLLRVTTGKPRRKAQVRDRRDCSAGKTLGIDY